MNPSPQPQRGFTLMELIMVIVIAGVLGTMTVSFITKPMEGYMDLQRRAQLVDSAEMSMRMMARDIRRALPNSLDASSGELRMINTATGGRYRAQPDPTDSDKQPLQLPGGYRFHVVGPLTDFVPIPASQWVVIYNITHEGSEYNAYQPGHNAVKLDEFTSDHITTQSPFDITQGSPSQRFYIVDEVISYCCAGGTLYRSTYPLGNSSPACTSGAPVAAHVYLCEFDYASSTATRAGLVSIELGLEKNNEAISLMHQVHVDNVP